MISFDWNTIKNWLLVILVLVIALLCWKSCTDTTSTDTVNINGQTYQVLKRDTVTVKIPISTTKYIKGSTIWKDRVIQVPVPANIDTLKVVDSFYSLSIYRDTLQLKDSMGIITVTDSISRNQILSRMWEADINTLHTTNTIYVKDLPKREYYLGGNVTVLRQPSVFVGANFLIKTKIFKCVPPQILKPFWLPRLTVDPGKVQMT